VKNWLVTSSKTTIKGLRSLMITYPDCFWPPAPMEPGLLDEQVHLWLAPLNLMVSHMDELRCLLSLNELERSEHFHFTEDFNRFIVTRGMLRIILGRYLKMPPGQLQLSYGFYGKPFLAKRYGEGEIHFNLSHSGNIALYCVTRGRKVGIDIEHVQPIPEADQLVERFFCAKEKAVFCNLSADEFPEAFFQYWTRKEAFIKARGEGLTFPLDRFDVSMVSDTTELRFVEDSGKVSCWSFYELSPEYDYVATLVVEGSVSRVSCWQLTELDVGLMSRHECRKGDIHDTRKMFACGS
jgi:4'-phosphopantetheinyl transferase